MLWDLIRDFFVLYIFGGCSSGGDIYGGLIGYDFAFGNQYTINDIGYVVGTDVAYETGQNFIIGLGDWLSTTATIISITIIVVLCCLFVYKIIKLIGGLIR